MLHEEECGHNPEHRQHVGGVAVQLVGKQHGRIVSWPFLVPEQRSFRASVPRASFVDYKIRVLNKLARKGLQRESREPVLRYFISAYTRVSDEKKTSLSTTPSHPTHIPHINFSNPANSHT